ncbi:major facilitator superfamily MFS_1 [Thermoproteus uzoniensis 768-20]|uniref:Major facilitator superfamily MFS_1 n=1 Tax=Thermoproteus uzoniensis (strain 768-20) TaxID=999630 RepID=F2L0E6_THEU7|nr:MFS transporter [Thermoproteus uzoniensis]AEA12628.1 major facilitator superfamily MFS_1 [Thermoproteus uzoniensis 768-20]
MRRLSATYLPVLVARVGSGAGAAVTSFLFPGQELAVGAILAVYPLLEALGSFAAGRYADRFGRRPAMILGYLARLAATALMYPALVWGAGPLAVGALNAASGFFTAFILVSSLAMVTDLTDAGNRGLGMGAFELANLGGYAVGYVIGAALFQTLGGAGSFAVLAAFTAVLTPFVLAMAETAPVKGLSIPLNPFKGLPPTTWPAIPLWFALTTFIGMGIYSGRAIANALSASSRLAHVESGLLLSGALIVVGLGAVLFGRLSDRWGRERTLNLGIAGVMSALAMLALLLGVGLPPLLAVALASPLVFLASAIAPSVLAIVGDRALITMRGTAMGLYSVVLGVGMALGAMVGAASAVALGGLLGIVLAALAIFSTATALYFALKVATARIRRYNGDRPASSPRTERP